MPDKSPQKHHKSEESLFIQFPQCDFKYFPGVLIYVDFLTSAKICVIFAIKILVGFFPLWIFVSNPFLLSVINFRYFSTMKTRLLSSLAALAVLVLLPLASMAQTNTTPGAKALCYSFDTSYLCIPQSCQGTNTASGQQCNLSHSLGLRIALTGGSGCSITNVTVKRAGSNSPDCFMAIGSGMAFNPVTCSP